MFQTINIEINHSVIFGSITVPAPTCLLIDSLLFAIVVLIGCFIDWFVV
jgi:hypothetical protein